MSSATAYSFIKAFLVSQFSGSYSIVDYDEIDNALAQGTDPFLSLEEMPSSERSMGIGGLAGHDFAEEGGGVVHCFTPAPASLAAARTIADLVQGALRFRQLATGFRIETTSPGDPEEINDGLWTAAGVAFSFSREFQVDLDAGEPGETESGCWTYTLDGGSWT